MSEVMYENKTPLKYDGFCFCCAHTNLCHLQLCKFKKVLNLVHSINISDNGKWALIMNDVLQVLLVKMDFLFGHTCWQNSPKGCDDSEHIKLFDLHLFYHDMQHCDVKVVSKVKLLWIALTLTPLTWNIG